MSLDQTTLVQLLLKAIQLKVKGRSGMVKGLTLKQSDVERLGKQAKLFSGRPIMITGTMTHVRDFYYHNRRKIEVKSCEMSLESVFPQIKRVLDDSGIVIAERLNPRAALVSTGKGKCKQLKKIDEKFVKELAKIAIKREIDI